MLKQIYFYNYLDAKIGAKVPDIRNIFAYLPGVRDTQLTMDANCCIIIIAIVNERKLI